LFVAQLGAAAAFIVVVGFDGEGGVVHGGRCENEKKSSASRTIDSYFNLQLHFSFLSLRPKTSACSYDSSANANTGTRSHFVGVDLASPKLLPSQLTKHPKYEMLDESIRQNNNFKIATPTLQIIQ